MADQVSRHYRLTFRQVTMIGCGFDLRNAKLIDRKRVLNAIGTAPSVRVLLPASGWPSARPSSYRCRTFM